VENNSVSSTYTEKMNLLEDDGLLDQILDKYLCLGRDTFSKFKFIGN